MEDALFARQDWHVYSLVQSGGGVPVDPEVLDIFLPQQLLPRSSAALAYSGVQSILDFSSAEWREFS